MALEFEDMPIFAGTLSKQKFVEDVKRFSFVERLLDGDW